MQRYVHHAVCCVLISRTPPRAVSLRDTARREEHNSTARAKQKSKIKYRKYLQSKKGPDLEIRKSGAIKKEGRTYKTTSSRYPRKYRQRTCTRQYSGLRRVPGLPAPSTGQPRGLPRRTRRPPVVLAVRARTALTRLRTSRRLVAYAVGGLVRAVKRNANA